MEVEYVRNHLNWNRLAGRTYKAVHCARSEQAPMRRSQSLPDASQHNEHRKYQADCAPAKDITQWYDDEVREAEGDDGDAGKHRELVVVEMELLAEQRKHRSYRQCAGDGYPREEPLAGHYHDWSVLEISRR
jgi:hypothetical protein